MDYDAYLLDVRPTSALPPPFPRQPLPLLASSDVNVESSSLSSSDPVITTSLVPALPEPLHKTYILEEKLGSGSFGAVYRARVVSDPIAAPSTHNFGSDSYRARVVANPDSYPEQVAIKVVQLTPYARESDEIQSLKDLSLFPACNRYIVCYYDSFRTQENLLYIVMEYISGQNLAALLSTALLDKKTRLSLAKQLLLGLSAIHNRGYAHRDIKPGNIMVTPKMEIKYVDFGLACKLLCEDRVGTVLYNPPEYYNGTNEASVTAAQAHDVWSLGVVFYNIVMGANSFPFLLYKNRAELAEEIMQEAPVFAYRFLQQAGPLRVVTERMLDRDWRARPLADDLVYMLVV